MYKAGALSAARPVSLQVRDQPLVTFLEMLLKNQPLKYIIEHKTILVTAKMDAIPQAERLPGIDKLFQPPPVKGRVVDITGKPLAGATISVKGGKGSATTNAEGNFSIPIEGEITLLISYVGYETKAVQITAGIISGAQSLPLIVLAQSNSPWM